MENSQTTAPHTTSSVAVPQPTSLEGHPHSILVDDHHRGSSGGRTFLKSTTAATSSSQSPSSHSNNNNNLVNSGGGVGGVGTRDRDRERDRDRDRDGNNSGSNNNSSSIVTTPSTRRTRHRVDAGEPRGCFNNYYSPRNIFQNSSHSPISSSNNNNNSLGALPVNNLSNSLVVGNSISGAADYYFQPMKMLSDFIGNSHSHFNSHSNNNSTTAAAASQLLLREMLQKKKIGYEDDVSEIQREREIQSSEESIGCSSGVTNNNNNNSLNNNNEEIKINGCKKRKLYQPQKSEFDDEQEEFKDLDDDVDMEYKNNHSADEDEEIMLKSPMAPLTRQLLTCERKQIPRSILQSWKENFKSTLMTHINELVDSQFNVLFGSMGNNSLPNSQHNSQPSHHPQQQTQQQQQQQQQQQHQQQQLQQLQQQHHHPHHHHSMSHPPTRQQSITPPPSTGSTGSVPTGPSEMMGASTKNHHFNGGGSILLNENENKLRMRFFRPPYSSALAGLAANNNRDVYDDDGPLSLVVTPKKKRHKVTDTRLTPRAVSRLLGNGSNASDHYLESTPSPRPHIPSPPSSVPISLPTSVAIPNPSLTESRHLFAPYAPLFSSVRSSLESPPTMLPHPMMNPVDYVQQLREISAAQQQAQREHQREQAQQATILERERGGSAGSADSDGTTGGSFDIVPGVVYGPGHSSSTLTPMHLRKAKLMFFWVRYPSSAVLKMYFPDIKFNKNNTAQLVKWFSNFREFYYIQMEKYARQALSEGIKIAEDIHVSTDNELYRVLNLHYNRNNHIEVPTNFRFVVEQTLREFFKAIQSGKDSEQSWKKAIYKIIARLDDPVPEYFKSPNFLEQLE